MKYTFGTTITAADRLERIADFFNPLAAKLISDFVTLPVDIAMDIGSGPGFTSDMLAKATQARKTIGLDNSPAFLELAGKRFPKYEFRQHDVTVRPFPVEADVMYERFVLPHLKEVIDLVNAWTDSLRLGGMLFIDELQAIDTDNPVFQRYLQVNSALVQSQGADLYVGKTLAEGKFTGQVVYNGQTQLPVANSQAAEWFFPNTVSVWSSDPFVRTLVSEDERQSISQKIADIKESGDLHTDIVWTMRRIVLRKMT